MKPLLLSTILLALLPSAQAEPEPSAARRLAAACANCHGTDGVPQPDSLPRLAGMPAQQMQAALLAYRNGQRSGSVMPQLAKGLSAEQIAALAAFFATQPAR